MLFFKAIVLAARRSTKTKNNVPASKWEKPTGNPGSLLAQHEHKRLCLRTKMLNTHTKLLELLFLNGTAMGQANG